MKCKNCQIELEASKGKKPRVFCSDKCRKAFERKETDILEADKIETDTPKAEETDKPVIISNTRKSVPKRRYVGSYLYELCPKHKGSMKTTCGCK